MEYVSVCLPPLSPIPPFPLTPLPLFDLQTQEDKQTPSPSPALSCCLTCVLMRGAGKSNIDSVRA
jgi:hypothetical protein